MLELSYRLGTGARPQARGMAMSFRLLIFPLVAFVIFLAGLALAATFDYTTLWAHLSDVEVPHYTLDSGGLKDVVIKGNFAYTVSWGIGLYIVDCTDPTSIYYRGFVDLYRPFRCDIRDHYVYVLDQLPHFDVVDVDDHDNPVLVNQIALPSPANDLLVIGPWLYVALADDRLAVFSLGTGTAPTLVNTVDLPAQHGERLVFSGGQVVAAGDAGLAILSVVMPEWPSVLGTIAFSGDTKDLSVRDDLALVGQLNQSRLINISDPANMNEVVRLPVQGWGVCLTSNGQAWLGEQGSHHEGGLHIYDITVPSSPQWLHDEILGFRGHPRAMVEYQGLVYAGEYVTWHAGEWAGFHVLQLGDFSFPEPMGSAYTYGMGMLVNDLQVDLGWWGLNSWDLSDPQNPQFMQTLGGGRAFYRLAEESGTIVADTYQGDVVYGDHYFQVVSRTGFGEFSLRGECLLPIRVEDLDVWGSVALAALHHTNGLLVIDISDPDAPVIMTQMMEGEYVKGVAIHGQLAAVGSFQLLQIFDLTNPQEPVLLASEPIGPYWMHTDLDIVERDGSLWLLGCRNRGANYDSGFAEIYDITDPTAPRLAVSQRQLANEEVCELAWHDDLLIVPCSFHLTFYRCFDPDLPVEFLGRLPLFDGYWYGQTRWAAVMPTFIATVSNNDVLQTWPLPYGAFSSAPQLEPLPAPPALEVLPVPNPFNPICEMYVSVPVPGDLRVEVFDAGGRRVRTLLRDHVPTGMQTMRWDGRDAQGRPAPAGVYLARCSVGGQVTSVKLTLAK